MVLLAFWGVTIVVAARGDRETVGLSESQIIAGNERSERGTSSRTSAAD